MVARTWPDCSLTLTIFDRKSGFKLHMQLVQCVTEIGIFPQRVSHESIFQELGEFSRQKSQHRMLAYPFNFMRMSQFIRRQSRILLCARMRQKRISLMDFVQFRD